MANEQIISLKDLGISKQQLETGNLSLEDLGVTKEQVMGTEPKSFDFGPPPDVPNAKAINARIAEKGNTPFFSQNTPGDFLSDLATNTVNTLTDPRSQRDIGAMIGGTLGSTVGAGAAGVGAPVGGVLGGMAGAMTVDAIQDIFGVQEKQAQSIYDEVAGNAAMEIGFSTVASMLKSNFITRAAGAMFRLGSESARQAAFTAKNVGINLAASDIGGEIAKGIKRVAGVFPLSAGPVMKHFDEAQRQVASALNKELYALTPSETFNKVGLNLYDGATSRFRAYQRQSKYLYSKAWDLTEKLTGGHPVIDTTAIINSTNDVIDKLRLNIKIPTKTGETIAPQGFSKEVLEFLEASRNLNPNMSASQLKRYQQDITGLFDNATAKDRVVLTELKKGAEKAFFDMSLPDPVKAQLQRVWQEANDFTIKWRKLFGSSAAQDFMAADKNIYETAVAKYGRAEADKLLSSVIDKESSLSIHNLFQLVKTPTAKQAVHSWLAEGMEKAMQPIPGKGLIHTDYTMLKRELGIGNPRSKEFHAAIKNLADVDMGRIKDIIDTAETIGANVSPSTFASRRAVMGGMRSALQTVTPGGAAAFGGALGGMTGGSIGMLTGIGILIGFRQGSKLISNTRFVDDFYTVIANPNLQKTNYQVYAQHAARLLNALLSEDERWIKENQSDVPRYEP